MDRLSAISAVILVFCCTLTLHSAAKEQAAVLEFKAGNCPDVVATTVKGMIGAQIFEEKIFDMIERSQVDQIFKEMALQQTGCTDSACAVQVGKILSAQKIITGAVYKMEDYTIVAKVINVEDGTIVSNFKATAADENSFDEAVADIVYRISSEYDTGINLTTSIDGAYFFPAGDLSSLVNGGFGTALSIDAGNLFFQDTLLRFNTGYLYFAGKAESVKTISMVPLSVAGGYNFRISRNFNLAPLIGGGVMVNMMNYDANGPDVFDVYEYRTETFFDAYMQISIDLRYEIYRSLYFSAKPTYITIFESDTVNHLMGLTIGLAMRF